MFKVLLLLISSVALIFGIPLDHTSDDSVIKSMNLGQMANIMMSSHSAKPSAVTSVKKPSVHSSHLIEVSNDLPFGALLIPLQTMAEAGAVGGTITAAAGVKGTIKGSAIATPIILKAVALPGIAAGATAAIMSVPKLLVNSVPQLWSHNLKTTIENSANLANLFIVEDLTQTGKPEIEIENDSILDINKGFENMVHTVDALKVGALGLATKGLVVAKKGAVVAGRVILKPIAILTGVHLKMIGSGLALGGKLIGGTGAGIAKAGTIVKYAGLGHIGLGASAIGWGLDKSTIDVHFNESHQKFTT